MAEITDIAWVAGFVDGEGCIHITRQFNKQLRSGYRYRLTVSVSNRNLKNLHKVQKLFGGSIHTRPDGVSNLQITGETAAAMLTAIIPFLTGKKNQAKLGIAFQARRERGRYQTPAQVAKDESDYTKMRNLKAGV